jgi:putative PEP-CTERM system histidine kinase
MTVFSALPFAAALSCLLLAVASVVRKKPTAATWFFFGGMAVLGLDSLFTGLSLLAVQLRDALRWLTLGLIAKSLVPATWVGFSLTYSRGDYRSTLERWRIPLGLLAILPGGLSIAFADQLLTVLPAGSDASVLQIRFGAVAKLLNVLLLFTFALVLMNLEQTFRAAVGTMRWRMKYVVLGLAVIFGGHLYVRSQAILYSAYNAAVSGIESSALLLGCGFLTLAYARAGFHEADVYPSRAVIRSSFTVLIVGGYLFIVGVLAQVATRFGGAESFQFQALVVLLGMAGLAVLLLSDRLRQRVHQFVVRHFRKAQHDSVQLWAEFSRRLAHVTDEAQLCASSSKFVSEAFDVLSVTVWLLDGRSGRLTARGSTARQLGEEAAGHSAIASSALVSGLRAQSAPFALDLADQIWANELLALDPMSLDGRGGHRWCVPLTSGGQALGAVVLADRVNGAPYTSEELALLTCIGDQLVSVLLNLRLANEVAQAKELEAFRTMSAFFVHDLKNAAASLNLMLKNLPVHFDNPEFRADALRAIGNAARRIEEMIGGLSALRQRPDAERVDIDLNELVVEAIDALDELRNVDLTKTLQPLPRVSADREQIRSVVANLLLNARDSLGSGGRIDVRTEPAGEGVVVLSVTDNGSGMNEAFMRDSLFRPFQSTKRNGLGIGMFQARMTVEAHGGSIDVESAVGNGTTFRVSLPTKGRP